MGFLNKKVSFVFIIVAVLSLFFSSVVYSKVNGPGWFMENAELLSHEEAEAYYNSAQSQSAQSMSAQSMSAQSMSPLSAISAAAVPTTAPLAATVTVEIMELARSLQYDPKAIYDYVHNKIEYIPYYGSRKGATLTYLDGSGNDFDQASLMVALLRESSIHNSRISTVQYVFGTMEIPGGNIINWLGVENDNRIVWNILAYGGIPSTVTVGSLEQHNIISVAMDRVWVTATIDGTAYLFDPAFKLYEKVEGIDIGNAINYDRNNLLSEASIGAAIDNDSVQNLNENRINNKLIEYSTNLINIIKSQYPNSSLKEIIGGYRIVQNELEEYQTTLPFQTSNIENWDEIPQNKTAFISIEHEGIDYPLYVPEIAGKRITLTYNGNIPELRIEGDLVATGSAITPGSRYDLVVNVDHPYAFDDGEYADQIFTSSITGGEDYAIAYNFGGNNDLFFQKRQKQLDKYLSEGLSESSEAILGETLNIMGLAYIFQAKMTINLLSALSKNIDIPFHEIVIVQKIDSYYKVNVTAVEAFFSRNNGDYGHSDYLKMLKTSILFGSAAEHGVIEQIEGIPGISTIKMLQIANERGNKIFYADSSNFDDVRNQLSNYDISLLQSHIDDNFTIILPDDGQLSLGEWSGYGLLKIKFEGEGSEIAAEISGGYNGGYSSVEGYVEPLDLNYDLFSNLSNNDTSNTFLWNTAGYTFDFGDPVDVASGSFHHENTDLTLGGNAPMGLSFSRFYNSNLNYRKRDLGYGWIHNYDIYISESSHTDPMLGNRQPLEASAMIVNQYVSMDLLFEEEDDILLNWIVAALSTKWATDQLNDNAVTVHLGNKLMEFVKLPDGSYSSPPGVTTELIDNGDDTFSLQERFGTTMDFDTSGRITQVTDADSNAMTFSYVADKLDEVRDAFNRTLTFTYNGDLIDRVTDSTGRYVSFGYTDEDLTTYSDPEGKDWGYVYDDPDHPHRMTRMINPLSIISPINEYDSLGRVKLQTVARQTGTAQYEYFFTGYRNVEVDPDGYTTIYYVDEKGRLVAEVDKLGNKSTKEYDNQFHIVKSIDPRGNETEYIYDDYQNLIRTINAIGESTDYLYDSEFRLTDTINPLYHGTHVQYDTEHHPILTQSGVQYEYDGEDFQMLDIGLFQNSATFYPNGLTWTTTDGRDTKTTFTYDGNFGKPKTTRVFGRPLVTTVYNEIGLMTSLADQVEAVTSFPEYNLRGQLKRKIDPLFFDTTLEYDDAGRLDNTVDRNSEQIGYFYTPTGKMDTITYPDLSTVSFTYNIHDNLDEMHDDLGLTNYYYDDANRLNYVIDPNDFEIFYDYDEAGNMNELTYPGDKKVKYFYDSLNRIKTVTIEWLSPKQTATYYYDAAGRLDYVQNFNGTITDYTFDNANRLTDLVNKKADNTIIAEYHYILDGNGNIDFETKDEPLSLILDIGTIISTYNPEGNRLETLGGTSFRYDDEGQLENKGSNVYDFDYAHRLKTITGASSVEYFYDGKGKRLKAIRDGIETRYIYDAAGNLLAEADENNAITKYFIYGTGLLAMVMPGNEVYTYHYNTIGSTVAMTDDTEEIVNRYAYMPFGELANENATINQPFKFVGKHGVMTELNGFYYMRARYYDPEVGRFISEDPLGFDGGDINLFAYVGNNPIYLADPFGLFGGPTCLMCDGNNNAFQQMASNPYALAQETNLTNKQLAVHSTIFLGVPSAIVLAGAASPYVTTAILSNPQGVKNSMDFITSYLSTGPPEVSKFGYLGGLAGAALNYSEYATMYDIDLNFNLNISNPKPY